MTEAVQLGEHNGLLHAFQIYERETENGQFRHAVLAFDTERQGKSFDLIIKDID